MKPLISLCMIVKEIKSKFMCKIPQLEWAT